MSLLMGLESITWLGLSLQENIR